MVTGLLNSERFQRDTYMNVHLLMSVLLDLCACFIDLYESKDTENEKTEKKTKQNVLQNALSTHRCWVKFSSSFTIF